MLNTKGKGRTVCIIPPLTLDFIAANRTFKYTRGCFIGIKSIVEKIYFPLIRYHRSSLGFFV